MFSAIQPLSNPSQEPLAKPVNKMTTGELCLLLAIYGRDRFEQLLPELSNDQLFEILTTEQTIDVPP